MSSKLQVKIYGKTYTVRETESDIPIAQLSEYVDSKMKELAGSQSKMGALDVAILAALNIAQELMECRHEFEQKENEFNQRTREMAQSLSRELKH